MDQFKTLKNHVYDFIAEQIFLGKINPGEKIHENQICESLSVSRTPVREALIELSCFGVIDNIPRKGFVVRNLTLEDLAERYTTIGVLEGEAAAIACPKLDDRDLADMKFYLESMNLAITQGNYNMYHKQQEIFHQIFIQKCGNKVLIETLENLKKPLLKRDFNEDLHPDIKDILLETNKEHKNIYELFFKRDSKGVSDYLKDVHWRSHQAQFEVL